MNVKRRGGTARGSSQRFGEGVEAGFQALGEDDLE
jgi:hypothetical protein